MNHMASTSIEQSRGAIAKALWRRNVGGLDRTIRLLIGSILLTVGIFLRIHGYSNALTIGIIGLVMLVMSAIGFCPLYVPFGISTADRQTGANAQ